MRRVCRIAVVVLAFGICSVKTAAATPVSIGELDYDIFFDIDGSILFGPVFTVQNYSDALASGGDDFTDVTLHLRQNQIDLSPIVFPDNPLGISGQTSTGPQDLTSLTFNTAFITLGFAPKGTMTFSPPELTGITTTEEQHLVSFIIFDASPTDTNPTPVPEPATLTLTVVGAGVAAAKRRLRR